MTPGWEVDFRRLSAYIEAALAYTGGTHRLEDVQGGIERGALQFWPAPTSCIITEINEAPTGVKTVNFFLAGGNLAELEPLHYIILEWAKTQGCTRAMATGRKGWERTFLTKEAGWLAPLTCYVKEL